MFNPSGVDYRGLIKCETFFKIDKSGGITDIIIKSSPYNPKMEKSILDALHKIKGRWILPPDYSSRKELSRVRFPISFCLD